MLLLPSGICTFYIFLLYFGGVVGRAVHKHDEINCSKKCLLAVSPFDITKDIMPTGLGVKNTKTPDGDLFKELNDTKSIKRYTEIHDDGQYTSLCWVEITNIIEKSNGSKSVVREYAIVLETPSDIPDEYLEKPSKEDKEVMQYELFDANTKKSQVVNFTTISKSKNEVIRQNRKLLCGSGPILTKEYMEWPLSKRKRIEIKVSPKKQNLAITNCLNGDTTFNQKQSTEQLSSKIITETTKPVEITESQENFAENTTVPTEESEDFTGRYQSTSNEYTSSYYPDYTTKYIYDADLTSHESIQDITNWDASSKPLYLETTILTESKFPHDKLTTPAHFDASTLNTLHTHGSTDFEYPSEENGNYDYSNDNIDFAEQPISSEIPESANQVTDRLMTTEHKYESIKPKISAKPTDVSKDTTTSTDGLTSFKPSSQEISKDHFTEPFEEKTTTTLVDGLTSLKQSNQEVSKLLEGEATTISIDGLTSLKQSNQNVSEQNVEKPFERKTEMPAEDYATNENSSSEISSIEQKSTTTSDTTDRTTVGRKFTLKTIKPLDEDLQTSQPDITVNSEFPKLNKTLESSALEMQKQTSVKSAEFTLSESSFISKLTTPSAINKMKNTESMEIGEDHQTTPTSFVNTFDSEQDTDSTSNETGKNEEVSTISKQESTTLASSSEGNTTTEEKLSDNGRKNMDSTEQTLLPGNTENVSTVSDQQLNESTINEYTKEYSNQVSNINKNRPFISTHEYDMSFSPDKMKTTESLKTSNTHENIEAATTTPFSIENESKTTTKELVTKITDEIVERTGATQTDESITKGIDSTQYNDGAAPISDNQDLGEFPSLCDKNAKQKLLVRIKVLLEHQIESNSNGKSYKKTDPLLGFEKNTEFDLKNISLNNASVPKETINKEWQDFVNNLSQYYFKINKNVVTNYFDLPKKNLNIEAPDKDFGDKVPSLDDSDINVAKLRNSFKSCKKNVNSNNAFLKETLQTEQFTNTGINLGRSSKSTTNSMQDKELTTNSDDVSGISKKYQKYEPKHSSLPYFDQYSTQATSDEDISNIPKRSTKISKSLEDDDFENLGDKDDIPIANRFDDLLNTDEKHVNRRTRLINAKQKVQSPEYFVEELIDHTPTEIPYKKKPKHLRKYKHIIIRVKGNRNRYEPNDDEEVEENEFKIFKRKKPTKAELLYADAEQPQIEDSESKNFLGTILEKLNSILQKISG